MYELVGIRYVDFTKDGNQIVGRKFFFEYFDDNIEGFGTESVFLSSEKFTGEAKIGKRYEITYNKYGKPQSLIEVAI